MEIFFVLIHYISLKLTKVTNVQKHVCLLNYCIGHIPISHLIFILTLYSHYVNICKCLFAKKIGLRYKYTILNFRVNPGYNNPVTSLQRVLKDDKIRYPESTEGHLLFFKRLTAFLLCAAVLFTFSSCKNGRPKNADKTIKYNLTDEPKTLDPQIASDAPSITVIQALFEGLVRLDSNGAARPGVALSWSPDESGKEFTFHLRGDAKWSDKDHTPVTASDFVFAFRRALSPQTGSSTSLPMLCIKNAQKVRSGKLSPDQLGVTAKDAHTLVVQLEYSSPDFPKLTAGAAFMPCNEKFFDSTSGRYGLDTKYLLGNGPFRVDGAYGWEHGKYLNLTRSDTYAGGQEPLPAAVEFSIGTKDTGVSDPVAALTAGTVDAIAVTEPQSEEAARQGCTLVSFEDITWGLCFNTQSSPTKNENVRKAFLQALDRPKILSHLPKDATRADNIVLPSAVLSGKSYRSQAGGNSFLVPQSGGAAQTLAAGLGQLGLSEPGSISVICPDDTNVKLMLNEMIASWNAQFHQYFNMDPLSRDDLDSRVKSGNYQIALCPISPVGESPYDTLSLFAGSSGSNPARLNDPAYDAMLENAQKAEPGSAAALYAAAEKHLNDKAVFYPIYNEKHYYAMAKGVTGVLFHPYGAGVEFIGAGKE